MKSKVLDRPMFKKSNKDIDPENVGIMQGFADMLDEDELAAFEDTGESKDYDTSEMSERTPKTPEILMNNLRGDMRSVDARVEELADLVGYNAAASTPTEVLALLQPVLAAEAQKGIGALPAAGMSQTPPGMMPPAMPGGMPPGMPPPGMPPAAGPGMDMPPIPETTPAGMPAGGIESLMAGAGGPAPVNMYQGGLVQRFQAGSTEAGVTPADSPAAATGNWPADTIALARQKVADYLLKQPLTVPDLAAATQQRVPLYERILGVDRNVAQGQALMDIGQAAFNYAANVDEQGRPLRGSAISRLSRAVSPLPGKLGARIAEQAKADQGIKLAALQATEAEQAKIREQNLKLTDAQREMWQKIAGASPTTPFGSGVEGRTLQFFTELAPGYAKGTLTPDQDRLFEVAVTNYTQKRPYEFTDTRGNRTVQIIQNELPAAVKQAIAERTKLNAGQTPTTPPSGRTPAATGTTTPSASGSTTAPAAPAAPGAATTTAPAAGTTTAPAAGTTTAPAAGTTTAPSGPSVMLLSPEQKSKLPPGWSVKSDGTVNIPPQSFYRPYNLFATNPDSVTYYQRPGSGTPTLFTAANLGTGPISAIGGFVYNTPGVGGAVGSELMASARKFIETTSREFGRALAVNPHYAEGEQKRIANEISIDPKLWDNPDALKSRIFVIEDTLRRMQKEALEAAVNTELSAEKQNNARSAVQDIHALRMTLGAPPVIYSDTDPRLKALAPGTVIIFRDRWAVVPQRQATQQGGRR